MTQYIIVVAGHSSYSAEFIKFCVMFLLDEMGGITVICNREGSRRVGDVKMNSLMKNIYLDVATDR